MPIVKEISKDFSEQGYCRFSEKLEFPELSVLKSKLHGRIQEYLLEKLTATKKESEKISPTPHLDKIMQSYKFGGIGKEILIMQEKKQMIEIESCYSEKTKTEGLYSLSDTDIDMVSKSFYRNRKEYSLNEIRQYFKDNYGLKISENPTEKEQKRMFHAWADKMNKTADKIISNQDSTLSKLESTLKEIRELKQKSK